MYTYNTERFRPEKIDAFYFPHPLPFCRDRSPLRSSPRRETFAGPTRTTTGRPGIRGDVGRGVGSGGGAMARTNGHSQTHAFAFFEKGVPPGTRRRWTRDAGSRSDSEIPLKRLADDKRPRATRTRHIIIRTGPRETRKTAPGERPGPARHRTAHARAYKYRAVGITLCIMCARVYSCAYSCMLVYIIIACVCVCVCRLEKTREPHNGHTRERALHMHARTRRRGPGLWR